ncbi:MAG: cation-translocating P-type ATPase, partial [Actinomycetota bacterium]|nr:cation-translocating P-type ATPase [Actinomycetota bacterium]
MLFGRVAAAATTVAQSGLNVVADLTGVGVSRRSWSGSGRVWLEVRGLDDPGGDELAAAVLPSVRGLPGVTWAELNRTLSRLVVSVSPGGPDVAELSNILTDLEHAATDGAGPRGRGTDLPGDGVVLAGRVLAVAADGVGLAAAVTGRVLRLPRLPGAVAAGVALVDTQPRLRRLVEARVGPEAADVALAVSTAAAQSLTQGPASLAVDLALRISLLAEARAGQRAWARHESDLSTDVGTQESYPRIDRPQPRPPGPIERYADAATLTGLGGAALIGAVAGSPARAADAILVAAPRATRTAREGFASTLGRGLSERDGALILRPDALRRFDRVDALLIDPAVLLSDRLTVGEVQGAEGADRTHIWAAAQADVAAGFLLPGWHSARGLSP